MALDFGKKKFSTYFLRVNNYKTIQIEVHPLENKDDSQDWFQDIHLQEVLTLLRDVINARVLQTYEDRTVKLPSSNDDILTGSYVKLAYSFRKKNFHQHCLMRERDSEEEYYDWTSVFKEKVVVYVLSKDSRSNTMMKLFKMVNSPIKNSQTISISNYFMKEPVESHQQMGKNEVPQVTTLNPPSEGRKMKLKRIVKKGTKLKKSKKQKKVELECGDVDKPQDNIDDFSDLCKTHFFDSTFDSIDPANEETKSDDIRCHSIPIFSELKNSDDAREVCLTEEKPCEHLATSPLRNTSSANHNDEAEAKRNEVALEKPTMERCSKFSGSHDSLAQNTSASPKFQRNVVTESRTEIKPSHSDNTDFHDTSPPGCSKRQHLKRSRSPENSSEPSSEKISSHLNKKTSKLGASRPRVKRRLPDFCSFGGNRKSVSHFITEYMNQEKECGSTSEETVEEEFECELLEELSNFPKIKTERDLEVRREIRSLTKVSELGEEHLRYLVGHNEPYLRSIFRGQFVSERHSLYKKGGKTRQNLNMRVHVGLFEEFQQDVVMETLMEMFCRRHNKYLDYIMKVLLPEMLIKIYMEVHETTHDEAEHAMHVALTNPGQIIQG